MPETRTAAALRPAMRAGVRLRRVSGSCAGGAIETAAAPLMTDLPCRPWRQPRPTRGKREALRRRAPSPWLRETFHQGLYLLRDHRAVLRRSGTDLADHRRHRAPGRAAVAMVGREVPVEDHSGAVGLRLFVEAREEAFAQRGARPAKGLLHQLVLGREVRVEPADGERGPLHHFRDPRARDPLLTDEPRRGLEDRFVRPFLLLGLRVHVRGSFQPAPKSAYDHNITSVR